ncbi:MAG: hypothetical protein E7474_03285 [Ruminococcaceae bacterium]|nr:hypothetical protein [Oscillospiraceae bacterium]
MKLYRSVRSLAMILCLCLLLTACGGGTRTTPAEGGGTSAGGTASGGASGGAAEAGGGTLTIAIQDEVEGCDVQQVTWTNVVHELIYEPLVVFSPDLSEIQPSFAESYSVTNDYIEFVLPADAKFSNGDALDANALKASVDRYLAISDYAGDLDAVSDIEVVDERTVRYNLTGPAPYMWCSIASIFGGVVDVAVAETVGDEEFNRQPVANGLYYVDEWVQGSQITLKRNEYFKTANPNLTNKGAAPFDTIVIRFIPDEFTRVSELESGDVDIIYNVPTTSMADLEANPDVNVYNYLQPGVSFLNLQTGKGLLEDANVRMALSYAVDRDELNAALDGVVTPTYGFISEAQAGYSAAEEAKLAGELAFAPDKAKQLLADAGWADVDGDGILEKDGQKLSFEMLLPSDRASLKASGPVLQKQFAAIGVDAQIREYEADYIKQQMREDAYDMGSRNFEWADADILYYVFTEESGYQWDDPAVTAALVTARQENDTAKRVDAYAAASELLAKDFKAISLFADNYIIATKGNINGLIVTNDGRSWLSDVTKN